MYIISSDYKRRIIEVKLIGLCSLGEFESFTNELRSTIAKFPKGAQAPATLYDFTKASLQTQEVVAAMKALAESPAMKHRRVALYTEGVLAKRQAERICQNRSNMFVFTSRSAALNWIIAGEGALDPALCVKAYSSMI